MKWIKCNKVLKEKVEILERENSTLKEEYKGLIEDKEQLAKVVSGFNGAEIQLKNEILKLEQECSRVYQGHNSLMEEINFLKFRLQETSRLHEEVVLRHWTNDVNRQALVCTYPFERIEILPRGEVYTCCSAYVKHNLYIGNIYEQSFDEIWNSDNAKKLRYSVSNGNFEFCNRFCKWLHLKHNTKNAQTGNYNPILDRQTSSYSKGSKSYQDCVVESYPKYVTLSCDESCNLLCPSCRSGIRVASKEESSKIFDMLEKLRPVLKDCELLGALGSGDFFASKGLMRFYKTLTHEAFPKLKLYIITNAQLFTVERWNEFQNLHDIPLRIAISIDAVQKQTYEAIRKGANWEILETNLELIRELRIKGNIEFLCFNFVVQERNHKEMIDFVEFALGCHADAVEFQNISNWGTFDDNQFKEMDVCNSKHVMYDNVVEQIKKILFKYSGEIEIIQNII
ncbi:SPASM domain-containing protein [Aminipila sp.]|uniref:SPASM domain-containing protein n=1 Tax=Aminipila sp. TaxID=2060095 RepID=UPI00289BBB10|nr:SPASM domain-containing protein [Aminipila sp.]